MTKGYVVKQIKNGWYNFSEIPQEGFFIKVKNLNCGTDQKAIKAARKILGDKDAVITITKGDSR